jgi:hypothetical protein
MPSKTFKRPRIYSGLGELERSTTKETLVSVLQNAGYDTFTAYEEVDRVLKSWQKEPKLITYRFRSIAGIEEITLKPHEGI